MKSSTPFIDHRARKTSRIARGWFRMMKDSAAAASAAQPDGSAIAENAEAPTGQPSGQFPNLPAVPVLAESNRCQRLANSVGNDKARESIEPVGPTNNRTLAAAGNSIYEEVKIADL